MNRNDFLHFVAALAFIILLAACGSRAQTDPTPVSALTPQEATALAENAMQGLKNGDYAVWTRDWSAAMKGAIDEEGFLAYRRQLTEDMGAYQSLESVNMAPGLNKGYVRWLVVANFEKGQVEFAFGFRQDGKLVEGVFPRQLG